MSVTLSSISLEYIRVRVAATENGAAKDPTALAVKFAFLDVEGTQSEPVTADWKTGTWESGGAPYYARILVGPGGTFVPVDEKTYRVWVQVTDTPEIMARRTDLLTIT